MFKYFKKNDPLRIIALVFIIIITRLGFFLFSDAGKAALDNITNFVQSPSENDSSSSFFTHSGPLSDLIFSGIDVLGWPLISIVIASLLILFNSIFLNSMFIRNSSFEESSFLPAAIFVILMSGSKSFYFLSPALLGSSFLLVSLNYLFHHIKYRGTEENILNTGFTIGIACLFYYPYFWLYFLVLIIYLFYSSTISRRYFLMTWGFVLPVLIVWLVFYFNGTGVDFASTFFGRIVNVQEMGTGLNRGLTILSAGLVLTIISAIQSFQGLGMTNHQILVQKAMNWTGFFGVLLFAVFGNESLIGLILIIPTLSYFSTKMLTSLTKRALAEFLFLALIGATIATALLAY